MGQCACKNLETWGRAVFCLVEDESGAQGVECIECRSRYGPRHAPAARARLQAGGRLLLLEDLDPPVRTVGGGLTEEQVRQQRLAGLPGADAKGGSMIDLKALEATRPDLVEALRERVPISSALGRGVIAWPLTEALHDHAFSEITRRVGEAVKAKLSSTHGGDVYPMEYFLGKVIVQANGRLFELSYELSDAGEVTLGKPREVRVVFAPVETAAGPSADDVKEALERALTSTLTEEQRTQRRLAGLPG